MTKQEAIQKIRSIQNGAGVDRNSQLDCLGRGRIAEKHWDDGLFTLGVEYGYIVALIEMFQITKDDLRQEGASWMAVKRFGKLDNLDEPLTTSTQAVMAAIRTPEGGRAVYQVMKDAERSGGF